MPMTITDKIKRLECLLEDVIMNDGPDNMRNKSYIDIFSKIESIVKLQDTISHLRHIKNLKDQDIYKGEVD